MIAYAFLDEIRDALATKLEHPVTIGEARQLIFNNYITVTY